MHFVYTGRLDTVSCELYSGLCHAYGAYIGIVGCPPPHMCKRVAYTPSGAVHPPIPGEGPDPLCIVGSFSFGAQEPLCWWWILQLHSAVAITYTLLQHYSLVHSS